MTQVAPDPPESLVAYQLRIMNEALGEIKQDIKGFPRDYVTRREWETRNAVVDGKVDSKGREIGRLEQKIDSASSHTRANVALIISGIVGAGGIIFGIIGINT